MATLLQRATSLLTDAANTALAPASRHSLAYDAAFALATAALRMRGYRADAARGNRSIVFQTLPHTVGAAAELWSALSAAHDRRNALEYSAALAPTQTEVADLLLQVRSLDRLVRKAAGR
ncbi:MAG TPA: hypothetical protein VLN25_10535 [Burkholderiaceae bacterium]|nr:hypothetical protein [Burkholderiaceae bacterium]